MDIEPSTWHYGVVARWWPSSMSRGRKLTTSESSSKRAASLRSAPPAVPDAYSSRICGPAWTLTAATFRTACLASVARERRLKGCRRTSTSSRCIAWICHADTARSSFAEVSA
jgi:hypothetical protein